MRRVTVRGWVGLLLLGGLSGCAKQDDPQPKLTRQANPDRKFEIQPMNNTAPTTGLPAKSK
jgi:hypothetical protein